MSSVFENKYKKISAILKKEFFSPLGDVDGACDGNSGGELSARHWLIK